MDAGASSSSSLPPNGALPAGDPPSSTETAGLASALRGFADGVLGSVHDRLELFSIELQEEKERLVRTVIWVSVLVCGAILTVLFASCLLVAACWDTPARLPIVAGLAVLYGVATLVAWFRLQRCVKEQPGPFAASLAELKADRRCLGPKE